MKRLLILVSLIAIGYFGYLYIQGRTHISLPPVVADRVSSLPVSKPNTDFLNVLGVSTTNLIAKGNDLLSRATNGKSEPIINKAVNDLQNRVKDLPSEEYKKVKYEFCKDVFPSPSPQNTL